MGSGTDRYGHRHRAVPVSFALVMGCIVALIGDGLCYLLRVEP